MMRVRVEIGEIVVDGVPVADPAAFRAALEATLADLAAHHSGAYVHGTAPLLQGAPVASSTADSLGQQVARSVWTSIVPGGTP